MRQIDMKRHWIEFSQTWRQGVMSYWVHVEVDGKSRYEATPFEPPKPEPVSGRGYAGFYVEAEGVTLYFASLAELRVCIDMLGQRVLPSTIRETERRGTKDGVGPNGHWLSRLPAKILPWPRRQRLVKYLQQSLIDFERETAAMQDA
jgi:hypothetical protein